MKSRVPRLIPINPSGPRTIYYSFRWMLSFHSRSAITENIFEYYGVSQIDGQTSPSELKQEVNYEDKPVTQMIKHNLFYGKSPGKLTTIINKDIAPLHIKESLLDNNGNEAAKEFIKDRLADIEGKKSSKSTFYCYNEKSKYLYLHKFI